VITYLAEQSERPLVAIRLWALYTDYLEPDSGRLLLRRQEMAWRLGWKIGDVTEALDEMVCFGLLCRKGTHYHLNPHVAAHLMCEELSAENDLAFLCSKLEYV
jgi:hypothetical protein